MRALAGKNQDDNLSLDQRNEGAKAEGKGDKLT